MKVNFDAPILNLDKKTPLLDDEDPTKEKPLTLGLVVCRTMLATFNDESNLAGEKKVERLRLAEKAYAGGEGDLTAEEVTLIKLLIAKMWTPLPMARAWELLDPPPESKKKLEAVKT